MPSIPTYERRRELGAPARPTQLSQAAAGADMQALAHGAQQIGGQVVNLIGQRRQEDEAKLEDTNALAASNALSKGDEYWNKRQTELQNSWKVGDAPIEDTLNKEFETWKGEQRSTLGTEKSRNWFDANAERMRSRMSQQTYNWQEKTRQDVEATQFKVGVDADLKTLSEHPEMHDELVARRLTAVGALRGMPEDRKLAIGQAFKKEAGKAVQYGEMLRDPEGWLARNTVKPEQPSVEAVTAAGAPAQPAGKMARALDPVAKDLPPEARGLLNVIATPESSGRYNVRYTPSGGAEFDPTGAHPGIMEPTKDGKQSSAAGRYQFTKTTWDRITGGKVPFTPENQDRYAWKLAQDDYKARTGKDLQAELKAGGVTPQILEGLKDTWAGLKSGKGAEKIYQETLARSSGQAPLTSSDSAGTHINPKADATFLAMDLADQQQMIDEANRRVRQQESQLRSQADRVMADATAMHRDGRPDPFNLGPEYFTKAYGAEDGARVYQNYAAGRVMANDIAAFATQSPEQIEATLAATKPDASLGEGYAAADARWNLRQQAAAQTLKLRAEDPMQFAMKNALTKAQPIDMRKPEGIGAELNSRVGVASMMATKYGTNLRPLTNVEAAQMGATMRALPPEAKLSYLEQVRLGLLSNPQMFAAVMGQIAPDSPTTAVAGSILVKQGALEMKGGWFGSDTVLQPRQVAAVILEGEAIINPSSTAKKQDGKAGNTIPLPKDADLETKFAELAGTAFRGLPEDYTKAQQAYKAYYAGKSARGATAPSTVRDDKLATEAFNAVTGGVIDYNGHGNVAKPWGMPDGEFKDQAAAQFDATMKARGYKQGEYEDLSNYGLMGVREGHYLVTSGNRALRDRQGNLVELTIQPLTGPYPESAGRAHERKMRETTTAPFSFGF